MPFLRSFEKYQACPGNGCSRYLRYDSIVPCVLVGTRVYFSPVSYTHLDVYKRQLLIGAIYLLARKHIDWKIPVIYIATVFVFGVGLGFRNGGGLDFALTYILSGGLVLGAFFMATDWVTTPVTKIGRIIFALGCLSLIHI